MNEAPITTVLRVGGGRDGYHDRNRALDQIRGIAILQVLAVHTLDRFFPGGITGVGIFFALSGYLTAAKLLGSERLAWREGAAFLIRRAARLYPVFLVVMTLIGLAIWGFAPGSYGQFLQAIPDLLVFRRPDPWEPFGIGIGILWSLRIEAQYYLLLPIALMVFGTRRGMLILALVLTLSSIGLAASGIYHARGESIFYCGLQMVAGSLIAYLERNHGALFRHGAWDWGWPAGLLTMTLLLFIPPLTAVFVWIQLTVGALATCVTIGALLHRPARRAVPGLPWMGRLAYALYLVHGPVIDWMRPVLGLSMWGKLIWFVPLTFGISWLIHVLVEKPMMGVGHRWARHVERAVKAA